MPFTLKKGIWKDDSHPYSNSIIFKVEHIRIGEIHWMSRSKDEKGGNWRPFFNLPGYKKCDEYFENIEDAKKWIEKRFKLFVAKIIEEIF